MRFPLVPLIITVTADTIPDPMMLLILHPGIDGVVATVMSICKEDASGERAGVSDSMLGIGMAGKLGAGCEIGGGVIDAPHAAELCSTFNDTPQRVQNLAPSLNSLPHFGQNGKTNTIVLLLVFCKKVNPTIPAIK